MTQFSRMLMILAIMAVSQSWASETIKPGDVLLLKAQIANCDAPAEIIDYVEVPESGEIAFFERFIASEKVRLSVNGRTPTQVAGTLADKLEVRNSHRPRTIEIIVLSGRDIIEAKDQLLVAAARKLLVPCGFWSPELKPDPNRKIVPDLPPLETKNLAQQDNGVTIHEAPAA